MSSLGVAVEGLHRCADGAAPPGFTAHGSRCEEDSDAVTDSTCDRDSTDGSDAGSTCDSEVSGLFRWQAVGRRIAAALADSDVDDDTVAWCNPGSLALGPSLAPGFKPHGGRCVDNSESRTESTCDLTKTHGPASCCTCDNSADATVNGFFRWQAVGRRISAAFADADVDDDVVAWCHPGSLPLGPTLSARFNAHGGICAEDPGAGNESTCDLEHTDGPAAGSTCDSTSYSKFNGLSSWQAVGRRIAAALADSDDDDDVDTWCNPGSLAVGPRMSRVFNAHDGRCAEAPGAGTESTRDLPRAYCPTVGSACDNAADAKVNGFFCWQAVGRRIVVALADADDDDDVGAWCDIGSPSLSPGFNAHGGRCVCDSEARSESTCDLKSRDGPFARNTCESDADAKVDGLSNWQAVGRRMATAFSDLDVDDVFDAWSMVECNALRRLNSGGNGSEDCSCDIEEHTRGLASVRRFNRSAHVDVDRWQAVGRRIAAVLAESDVDVR